MCHDGISDPKTTVNCTVSGVAIPPLEVALEKERQGAIATECAGSPRRAVSESRIEIALILASSRGR